MALADKTIKNIKLGKSKTESLGGRGQGVLFFINRFGTIEAYYRYFLNNDKVFVKIGTFKVGKKSGLTSKELRSEGIRLANLRATNPDLKAYLEYIEHEKLVEQQEIEQTGTFKDLLNSYSDSLANKSTQTTVEKLFDRDVIIPFPYLAKKKAQDITVNDIKLILKQLMERNVVTRSGKELDRKVTTGGNRLRTYLSACFNYAVKVTNDPLKEDKIFNIQLNPVVNIPKQTQFERTQDRTLSLGEVKHFLTHIGQTKNVSILTAKALLFLFYIAGQRPFQVMREPWPSYDYRRKTLLIVDTKGRGGKREYLTPLSPKVLSLLNGLTTQELPYPFCSDGKNTMRVETLLKAVQKYCNQYNVEKFTLRDIRRTCKNLMIDAGIGRETRNLIQNHGLTGIDYKHYDKSDHLPEKLAGMAKYDRFLDSIISDSETNVVQLITA